jgi:activator of HSP90 ATPase
MPRTIVQRARLAARPDEIYDMYLDSRAHAAITGAPARVTPRAGTAFRAFGGELRGRILQLVPKRVIVQSWRASNWRARDLDSTLVLSLRPDGRRGTIVDLVQVNVADHDAAGVRKGWEEFYWAPWRAYLRERARAPRQRTRGSSG